MIHDFSDSSTGGFYFTSQHAERLITRAKDAQDGSVPSGNSMAAWSLSVWLIGQDAMTTARLLNGTIESAWELMERGADGIRTMASRPRRTPQYR